MTKISNNKDSKGNKYNDNNNNKENEKDSFCRTKPSKTNTNNARKMQKTWQARAISGEHVLPLENERCWCRRTSGNFKF